MHVLTTLYELCTKLIIFMYLSVLIQDKDIGDQSEQGIVGLLNLLLSSDDDNFNLRKAIDSIEELSARTYGLPDVADANMTAKYSRY